jgi:ATP-dependent RNA helicase DeaD
MKDMNSWVEIESDSMNQMIRAIDGKKFRGRKIRMNDADTGGKRSN